MGTLQLVAMGLAAGAVIVLQQAANTSLRHTVDSTIWAGVVSYLGGTLSMLVFAAVSRAQFPAMEMWARVSPWEWIGGLFGALYIVIAIVLVPRTGTATFFALFVAGLMGLSLALDHFGVFGLPRRPLDLSRIAGGILVMGGAALLSR